MGYTIKKVLDDADTDSYRNLTKDHPLFSTMWFQRNKATYVKHFGESGYKEMLDAVLDHSNAAKLNLNAKGSKLIANIVAGVDCLGTTADIKMMKLFREPEIMRRLYQLEELRGQLKGVADGSARSKALVRRRNGIFNAMENHIDSMDIDDHLKAGYKRALEKESNFDMTQTGFAAKRDFGSHSAGFEDIDVHTDGSITVDMSVNKNFKLVREMFSDKGDDVSTSALAKTMDDFGLDIDTRGTRVTITRDGKTTTKLYTQQELAKDLEKLELGKAKGGLDSLTIQTPKAKFVFRKNADKGKELARVLRSEKAIKKALEVIGDRSKSKQEMLAAMSDATIKIKTKGYYLNGKPAKVALKKVSDLIGEGKIDRAISLLEDIRFKATTKKP